MDEETNDMNPESEKKLPASLDEHLRAHHAG